MVETYFFDTYALVELFQGNESYAKYADCEGKTSLLNLIEIYYTILKNLGKEQAHIYFKRIKSNLLEINEEDIFNAMEFKLYHKKKNFSYADCISYEIAKNKGIKFLTGDEQFRNMPNVEFVK